MFLNSRVKEGKYFHIVSKVTQTKIEVPEY